MQFICCKCVPCSTCNGESRLVQTQFCSGLRLKFCDDSILVVCMGMTNVADQYGLNLLDLLMLEVRVVKPHFQYLLLSGKS